jgi:hypothetical protein
MVESSLRRLVAAFNVVIFLFLVVLGFLAEISSFPVQDRKPVFVCSSE